MPKATSKTFKKKKYNARFPPARIKKIMQTDEEVGKVAAAVPVIICALEMFIESLILKTAKTTQAKNAKTLSTSHIKQTINVEHKFDFLRNLVKNEPDYQTEDNNGDAPLESEPCIKRGRGRPRKSAEASKPGRKSKSGEAKVSSDTSDDEEEYTQDEEDEDTETDEETAKTSLPTSSAFPDRLMPVQNVDGAHNGSSFYQPGFSGAATIPIPSAHSRNIILQCPPYLQPSQAPSSCLPSITHPPTHLMPQYVISSPDLQPMNLSNPLRPPATKEDDDYDS